VGTPEDGTTAMLPVLVTVSVPTVCSDGIGCEVRFSFAGGAKQLSAGVTGRPAWHRTSGTIIKAATMAIVPTIREAQATNLISIIVHILLHDPRCTVLGTR